MEAIGGYFEIEKQTQGTALSCFGGLMLNTGRNALEYVLLSLQDVSLVYIPYFTCDVVLEPFNKHNIKYVFYHITENLEIGEEINLRKGEYLLYTNYFGIKDWYVSQLSKKFGRQLIVDNAQALYAPPTENCIYSPRKYVGIPDGGIAFCDKARHLSYAEDDSSDRLEHLFLRRDKGASAGYQKFQENSEKLVDQPVKLMSTTTSQMLNNIDFLTIKAHRMQNFAALHKSLGTSNLLHFHSSQSFECPMVYPYQTSDETLRERLISNNVFVATYWPNVKQWCDKKDFEYSLTVQIIPLPCDQRYGVSQMQRIIDIIKA